MSIQNSIGFAERLMTLLDQGKFTATYKYAVLLALMDLVLERVNEVEHEPFVITTRQLAIKIIEIYWPHSSPYSKKVSTGVLKQNNGTQAKIISLIETARDRSTLGTHAPFFRLRLTAATRFRKLVDDVERVLIEMPLPRLQRVGKLDVNFIYDISWDTTIRASTVRAYQQGILSDFNNSITLKPNVAGYLVELSGLLRPVIQQQWTMHVALLNKLDIGDLHSFLFGQQRVDLTCLTSPIQELQNGRCFYCREKIGVSENKKPEVDHFIPWARVPTNDLFNLVVAHRQCNSAKRDFLASSNHLLSWSERLTPNKSIYSDLLAIKEQESWVAESEIVSSIVNLSYSKLMPEAELWQKGSIFEPANKMKITTILEEMSGAV